MILPAPSEDTAPFWEAAKRGKFLLGYCDLCDKWHHPRLRICTCGKALSWRESGGAGQLVSRTIVQYVFNSELASHVPYTLTLTRLAEGPQFISSIPGAHFSLCTGADMRVTFDPVTADVTLPRFVPTGA